MNSTKSKKRGGRSGAGGRGGKVVVTTTPVCSSGVSRTAAGLLSLPETPKTCRPSLSATTLSTASSSSSFKTPAAGDDDDGDESSSLDSLPSGRPNGVDGDDLEPSARGRRRRFELGIHGRPDVHRSEEESESSFSALRDRAADADVSGTLEEGALQAELAERNARAMADGLRWTRTRAAAAASAISRTSLRRRRRRRRVDAVTATPPLPLPLFVGRRGEDVSGGFAAKMGSGGDFTGSPPLARASSSFAFLPRRPPRPSSAVAPLRLQQRCGVLDECSVSAQVTPVGSTDTSAPPRGTLRAAEEEEANDERAQVLRDLDDAASSLRRGLALDDAARAADGAEEMARTMRLALLEGVGGTGKRSGCGSERFGSEDYAMDRWMERIEEETALVEEEETAAGRGRQYILHPQSVRESIVSNGAVPPQNSPTTFGSAQCSRLPSSRRRLRIPGVAGNDSYAAPPPESPVAHEGQCAGMARSSRCLLEVPEQMAASGSNLAMCLLANDDMLRSNSSNGNLKNWNTEHVDGDNELQLHELKVPIANTKNDHNRGLRRVCNERGERHLNSAVRYSVMPRSSGSECGRSRSYGANPQQVLPPGEHQGPAGSLHTLLPNERPSSGRADPLSAGQGGSSSSLDLSPFLSARSPPSVRSLAAELERDRRACGSQDGDSPSLDRSPLEGCPTTEVGRAACRTEEEEDVSCLPSNNLAPTAESSSLAATREALRSVTDLAARLGEAAEEAGESARRSLSSASALSGAGFCDEVYNDGVDGIGGRAAQRRQPRPDDVALAAAGSALSPLRALRAVVNLAALLVAVLLLSVVALGGGAAAWLLSFASGDGGAEKGRPIHAVPGSKVSAQEGGGMVRRSDSDNDSKVRGEGATK